jgi:hypothetical protein
LIGILIALLPGHIMGDWNLLLLCDFILMKVKDNHENNLGETVWIILARIINSSWNHHHNDEFNDNVESLALDRINNPNNPAYPDKIIIVDMEDGANINYDLVTDDPPGDMWDYLHPFQTGYEKMADVWFSGLEAILPVADAGSDQNVYGSSTVTLDASNSFDPDRMIVSYFWEQQPGGSQVILSDLISATPTFTAPHVVGLGEETLTFKVTVTDADSLESADTTKVAVSAAPDAAITLIDPNGGESIPSGSPYEIQWGATVRAKNYKLRYSLNNGKDWETIAKGNLGTTYDWQVPAPTMNANKCLVKLIGFNAFGERVGVDESDAPFTIEVMNVTSPNSGVVLASGGKYDVTWETNGTARPVDYVEIFCSINNGKTWKLMKTESGNPGVSTCVFKITKRNDEDCRVKVIAYDSADGIVAEDKSAAFTIEVVSLTSPNGGETLKSGTTHNIAWDIYKTRTKLARIMLCYTTNDGKTWGKIKNIKGSDPGTYQWKVPAVPKTKKKCKVRIQLEDENVKSLGTDSSDGFFTIAP